MKETCTGQDESCGQDEHADHGSQIRKISALLDRILQEAERLGPAIMTEEDQRALHGAAERYEGKMQAMLLEIRAHLELYRESGWKELIFGEERE